MADLGRWFKLWVSSRSDPSLSILPIADFGRWCKLGVYMKEHGTGGVVSIEKPIDNTIVHPLQTDFQVNNFDDTINAIKRFPNVEIFTVSNETLTPVSYKIKFCNWLKYQGDFSTYRVRKHREKIAKVKRSKRRREEKRREDIYKEGPLLSKKPEITPNELAESWNEICAIEGLSKVTLPLEGTRLKKIKTRIKEHPDLAFWDKVLNSIPESKFLMGKKTDWKITFDWMIENDRNCVKIWEGQYEG